MGMLRLFVLSVLAFSSHNFVNSIDDVDLTLKLNIAINTAEGQIKKESVDLVRNDGILKALGRAGKGKNCRISLQYCLFVFKILIL